LKVAPHNLIVVPHHLKVVSHNLIVNPAAKPETR
jgi:hypothetical protein